MNLFSWTQQSCSFELAGNSAQEKTGSLGHFWVVYQAKEKLQTADIFGEQNTNSLASSNLKINI